MVKQDSITVLKHLFMTHWKFPEIYDNLMMAPLLYPISPILLDGLLLSHMCIAWQEFSWLTNTLQHSLNNRICLLQGWWPWNWSGWSGRSFGWTTFPRKFKIFFKPKIKCMVKKLEYEPWNTLKVE